MGWLYTGFQRPRQEESIKDNNTETVKPKYEISIVGKDTMGDTVEYLKKLYRKRDWNYTI